MVLPSIFEKLFSDAARPAVEADELLYAGDKVWIEYPAEWSDWTDDPTYTAGILLAVDHGSDAGLVIFQNGGNLVQHCWFAGSRLSKRTQEKPIDKRVTATAVAIAV